MYYLEDLGGRMVEKASRTKVYRLKDGIEICVLDEDKFFEEYKVNIKDILKKSNNLTEFGNNLNKRLS
jgi:hypothetical protein